MRHQRPRIRSLLPWTLALVLGVLIVGVSAFTAGAQDGSTARETEGELIVEHSVTRVPVPASLQRAIVNDRLEAAKARLDALQARAGASGDNVDPSTPMGTAMVSLEQEISDLQARAAGTFTDAEIEMPYVTLRWSGQSGDGIAFSKFTYTDAGTSSSPVVHGELKQKDPTQIVMWYSATHSKVLDGFKGKDGKVFTRPPEDKYLWEHDDGSNFDLCFATHQYVAMQNNHEPTSGQWVWAKSTGLQVSGNTCHGSRQHLRYFSSDDNRRDEPAVGRDDQFRDWTVVAAHDEVWATTTHEVTSWERGARRVVDSLQVPSPSGPTNLSWVLNVQRRDFGNEGTYGARDAVWSGVGYVIKMITPQQASLQAPPNPVINDLIAIEGKRITLSRPSQATWFDYSYVATGGQTGPSDELSRVRGEAIDVTNRTVTLELLYDTEYIIRMRGYNARAASGQSSSIFRTGPNPVCKNGTVIPNHADKPGLVADCTALLASKDTLIGSGSGSLNWSADIAITSWDGITVASNSPSRVTKVNLIGGNLAGTIPPELGDLTGLQYLWLGRNALTGSIPPELGNLASLEDLFLAETQLSGSLPAELGNLTNLERLWVSKTQLSGSIPPELGNLTNLERVLLNRNQFSGNVPVELGNLTNLEALLLNVNQLNGSVPTELLKLVNLEKLKLGGNTFTGCLPPALRDIDNNDLDSLSLADCALWVTSSYATSGNAGYAKVGDTITATFTSSAALAATPTATIAGQTATVSGSGTSWTATYEVVAATPNGQAQFDLGEIRDSEGNTTNPDAVNTGIVVDTMTPTATAAAFTTSGNAGYARAGDTITATFTTSEAPVAAPVATIAGQTASVTETALPSLAPGTKSWRATYTVVAATPNGAASFDLGEISDAAGNSTDPAAADSGIVVDTVAPSVTEQTFSTSGSGTSASEDDTITVAFTTSEALAEPPAATIAGESATVMGSGTSWTATYNVTATSPNGAASFDLGEIIDAAGNATDPAAAATGITIETDTPVVREMTYATSGNDGYAKAGDTITVTFTTSEALASTPAATIAGQAATVTGSGTSWTATYAVTVTTPNGEALFDLGEISDSDGNASDPDAVSTGVVVDTVAPSTTAPAFSTSGNSGYAKAGDTITSTFTTSEALVAVPTATIAGQTATIVETDLPSLLPGTKSWRATYAVVAATPNGSASFDLGEMVDAAGNSTDPVATDTGIVVDTAAPTVTERTYTSSSGDTTAETGDTITVAFTTSEALAATPAATIAGQAATVMGSGTSWTATYTVASGVSSANAAFDLGEIGDAAGNSTDPAATNTGIAVETAAPIVTGTTFSTSGNAGYAKAGETITVTFTTSKALASRPTATIAGQAATVSGSSTSWTATYAVVAATPNGEAQFDLGEISDANSNTTDPAAVSTTIVVDTAAPTMRGTPTYATSGNAGYAKAGDTITVMFTTSESLAATPGATIAGGTATVSGSGTSWTASYEVVAGGTSANASFNLGQISDAAGNTTNPATVFTGIVVDTTAPAVTERTFSSSGGGNTATTGETITVAFTTSEGLAETPAATIAGEAATVSGSGTSWTATYTVAAGVSSANATFDLSEISDAAGNTADPAAVSTGITVTITRVLSTSVSPADSGGVRAAAATESASRGPSDFIGQFREWPFPDGTVVNVTARANPGYRFGQWSAGVCEGVSDPHTDASGCRITMNANKAVTAIFVARCTLVVTAGDGGTASGGGTVDCGQTLTVTADPDDDHRFGGWSGGGCGSSETCVVTVGTTGGPPTNVSVSATFVAQCSLVATAAGPGGTVTGGGTQDCGQELTATATANDGYCFSRWTPLFDGATARASCLETSTLRVPTTAGQPATHVYTASFEREQCTVRVESAGNGTVGGGGTVDCGDTVTITARANSNYCFDRWEVPSGQSTRSENEPKGPPCTTFKSTPVTADVNVTYTAHFVKRQYTLTTSAGANGSISPAPGTHDYNVGTTVTVTATPNSGYLVDSWGGSCSSATGTSCSLTMSTDRTASVTFEREQCTLTVNARTGGTASGTWTGDCGTTRSISATANAGYRFSGWTGDLTSTSASTTILVNTDKTVSANFIQQCMLTVNAGTGGTASGTWTGDCGTTRSISATANDGYRFSGWTGDLTSTSASTTILVNTDKTVSANFIRQCTLVVQAGTGGTVTGGGTVDCGQVITAQATADDGYCWDGWYEILSSGAPEEAEGEDDSASTLEEDEGAEGSHSCRTTSTGTLTTSANKPVRVFEGRFYAHEHDLTITTSSVNSGAGTVTPAPGTHTYDTGTSVTISAAGILGATHQWGGECSGFAATCTVTMDGDKSVSVTFHGSGFGSEEDEEEDASTE